MSYLMPQMYCELGYMVCGELIGRRVRLDNGEMVDLRVGDMIEVDGHSQQIVAMLGESGLYDADADGHAYEYELPVVEGLPVIPLLMACQTPDGRLLHHPLDQGGLSVTHVRNLTLNPPPHSKRTWRWWRR